MRTRGCANSPPPGSTCSARFSWRQETVCKVCSRRVTSPHFLSRSHRVVCLGVHVVFPSPRQKSPQPKLGASIYPRAEANPSRSEGAFGGTSAPPSGFFFAIAFLLGGVEHEQTHAEP